MTGQGAVTRKQYAEHRGCAPSYVTALGKQGRLVLDAQGRVLVAETDALIANTGGDRPDVAARHATGRTQTAAKAQTEAGHGVDMAAPEKSPKSAQGVTGERMADARVRKEAAQADQEEMKAAQMAGALVAREDVDAAMKFIGAAVRGILDVLPDQTAPLVAPTTSMEEVHALLTDATRNALHDLWRVIERQQDQLTAKGA